MFGGNDFPLGPNNQYPRQRISTFGNRLPALPSVEEVYRDNKEVRLPAVECDYSSSVEKAKRRMKLGHKMREGQNVDKFRPRHANKSRLRYKEEEE